MSTCHWPLGNGETLAFSIYGSDSEWNNVPGLYIFAYQGEQYWHPLYVGQTDDFSSRLPSHERWDEAVRKGATHIHALSVSQAAMRDTYEQLLIQNLQPAMNFQLR